MKDIFHVSRLIYPRVYEGKRWADNEPVKYGVSILAEELPDDLRPWAQEGRGRDGYNIIGIRSRIQPIVVGTNSHDLRITLQCARDSAIALDDLLSGVPADLAVERIEFDSLYPNPNPRPHERPTLVRMLAVRAIQVKGEDLVRRYDEMIAEAFEQ